MKEKDPMIKIKSLAALNRMGSTVLKGGFVTDLIKMLGEGQFDRQLLASCLKATGSVGEKIILKIFKGTNNLKVKKAIVSVLGWRVPIDE